MRAIRSLTWAMWQRNSRWLMIIAATMIAYCGYVIQFGGSIQHPVLFPIFSLVIIFGYLALTGIFMYQDSDVGVGGSAYPVHMFTLPVRTAPLVLIPMLFGTVTFLVTGFLISTVVSAAEHMPLYWPTVLGTATLAMLQAIFWYPIGIQYSKLVLTLVSIPTLFFIVGFALEQQAPERTVCGYLILFTVACYAIAYHGVARARKGDLQLFYMKARPEAVQTPKSVKWLTFDNASAAQRWYEWRQQGMILPYLVLFLCIALASPMVGPSTFTTVYFFGASKDGLWPMVPTFLFTYVQLFIALVPIVSWIVGCGAKRTDIKHADRTFMLFFGSRPMSDGGLVAQKIWSAMKSTLVAWGIVLAFFASLLLLVQGRQFDTKTQIINEVPVSTGSLLLSVLHPWSFMIIVFTFILLATFTWRNYVIGLWTELSGKTLLRYGYPVALLAVSIGGYKVTNIHHPTAEQIQTVYTAVLTAIWSANAVRLGLATTLVAKQLKSGLMTRSALVRGVCGYTAGIAILVPIALTISRPLREALVDAQLFSSTQALMTFIGVTILWIPIVRVLLATEMLHQNRHRAT